jgi:hypothetical protein
MAKKNLEQKSEDVIVLGWPNDECKGFLFKAVQLYLLGKPFLLLGDAEENVHGKMLQDFLTSKDISYSLIKTKFLKMFPALHKEEVYDVVGTGMMIIDFCDKRVRLPFDESVDYGVPADREFNKMIKATLLKKYPDWDFRGID